MNWILYIYNIFEKFSNLSEGACRGKKKIIQNQSQECVLIKVYNRKNNQVLYREHCTEVM